MTKAELIDRIARSRDLPPDISKKLIGQILGLAFDELASYFARARVTRTQSPRFTFPRFGTFTKKRRSARRGVNPRTLEPIQIEACDTVDFKASRELREVMNPNARGTEPEGEGTRRVRRTKTTATKKTAKRKTSKATKTSRKSAGTKTKRSTATGPGRRRLTPRDDEAELAALLEQSTLFDAEATTTRSDEGSVSPTDHDALPSSPMQRVSSKGSRRRSRSRGTG